VGKTSLVRRFVYSIFSDKYHSTIGVKIDKKTVQADGQKVHLLLWDIAGEEEYFSVPTSYIRGSDGYLLVVDGTRRNTLDQAMDLQQRAQDTLGEAPLVVIFNKTDLVDEWQLDENVVKELRQRNWPVLHSSAKLGTGVEDAFNKLTREMLRRSTTAL